VDRGLGEPQSRSGRCGSEKAVNWRPILLSSGQELIAVPTEPKCMDSIKFIRSFTCYSWAEGLLGIFTAKHKPYLIIFTGVFLLHRQWEKYHKMPKIDDRIQAVKSCNIINIFPQYDPEKGRLLARRVIVSTAFPTTETSSVLWFSLCLQNAR
jgi:hypothetical protein